MEKLLEAAQTAWNPTGEIRRRIVAGTLTVGQVFVPFISIVIICNLFGFGASEFFLDSVLYKLDMPINVFESNDPLQSDYSRRFIAAIGVIVPAAAVSLLPQSVFHPASRSSTIATMFVVAAAWSFYSAAFSVTVYFFSAALFRVNPDLSFMTLFYFGIPGSLVVNALALFFWFRITLSVLKLRGYQVTVISFVALAAYALMLGFFIYVAVATQVWPKI